MPNSGDDYTLYRLASVYFINNNSVLAILIYTVAVIICVISLYHLVGLSSSTYISAVVLVPCPGGKPSPDISPDSLYLYQLSLTHSVCHSPRQGKQQLLSAPLITRRTGSAGQSSTEHAQICSYRFSAVNASRREERGRPGDREGQIEVWCALKSWTPFSRPSVSLSALFFGSSIWRAAGGPLEGWGASVERASFVGIHRAGLTTLTAAIKNTASPPRTHSCIVHDRHAVHNV